MTNKPFENPLTPNKLLREMYVAMLEARALGKRAARSRRKPPSIAPFIEACWTATAIGLRGHAEDLVSEPGVGPALDVILGAKLKAALKASASDQRRLPPVPQAVDRLRFALGAAMAIKAAGQKGVLLAFAHASELSKAEWKPILTVAVSSELPLVFVVLPEPGLTIDIASVAQACALPAIPVDAADAVAIYRVAQESIGRARAGGGAALIAGITLPAGKSPQPPDPLTQLGRQLLAKKACTARWLSSAEQKTWSAVATLQPKP